jgi:hypothetical protein
MTAFLLPVTVCPADEGYPGRRPRGVAHMGSRWRVEHVFTGPLISTTVTRFGLKTDGRVLSRLAEFRSQCPGRCREGFSCQRVLYLRLSSLLAARREWITRLVRVPT